MTTETIPDSVKLTKTLTVEKVFAVGRKRKSTINISRKGSIVKERCQQLCGIALELFPERVVSEDDLSYMIMRYVGSDKETVRAYMGYYGHIRAGRCGDNRIVGLSRKGYLEVLGFAHKISFGRWVIHAQAILSSQASEGLGVVSNKNFSISQSGSGCVVKGVSSGSNVGSSNELEEEEATEKDRNLCMEDIGKVTSDIMLSAEEKAILAAKPSSNLDRGRVDWGVGQE